MARVVGPFKITGTISGMNFYQDGGENYVRNAGGGFDGNAIKTKDSMVRVRENASEFGHCASVKSTFMHALHPYLSKLKGRKLHSEMTSLFVQIKNFDPVSKRGKRRVSQALTTTEGHNLLLTYSYPEHFTVDRVLGNRFIVDPINHSWSCTDFNVSGIDFPEFSTHVGLLYGIVVMDFEAIQAKVFLAEDYYIAKKDVNHYITLKPLTVPSGTGVRIAVMGVRFYQEVNGVMTKLEAKRGFAVVGVD
ncbi:MAG: hypothetical protein AUK33_00465 [Flavobacteriaceae bacterium CG2_30_34_30]|nr:hypothetical protein [Flavobacteriia bacterium]OIP52639.1 MAG: hypothetical protein AUK33_00465 [Flavobacteriaceae bacterium CG2_30_34_30]PIQ16820.1 MAG: hypothetical protein COW66_14230 [Flavobacteriaceae bacterium CG18_big_fil_WC_8_21_14_2_50_34_36]PIZ07217.1 MAG: hypothetical protein COY56_10180 [Flavobacteriaceae bacterium CG_4_10_14_0_8_um_filter_34_31]PJC07701.1 MAG: hypothetical protein CO068_04705 [Flavobacteriaceae bacterium CG_4_9_14_0_8_um_filter_34_30]